MVGLGPKVHWGPWPCLFAQGPSLGPAGGNGLGAAPARRRAAAGDGGPGRGRPAPPWPGASVRAGLRATAPSSGVICSTVPGGAQRRMGWFPFHPFSG